MKTFQKNGKWVDKTTATHVQVCLCGNRYIKTRDGQTTCIKCLIKRKVVS